MGSYLNYISVCYLIFLGLKPSLATRTQANFQLTNIPDYFVQRIQSYPRIPDNRHISLIQCAAHCSAKTSWSLPCTNLIYHGQSCQLGGALNMTSFEGDGSNTDLTPGYINLGKYDAVVIVIRPCPLMAGRYPPLGT